MRYGLQLLTKEKQEGVRTKEEEDDKHCHYKEWDVFTNEIFNIYIIQPCSFVVLVLIVKVNERNCSDECAEDLCI